MQVKVLQVMEGTEGWVRFACDVGEGLARWHGAAPAIHAVVDVELDIAAPLHVQAVHRVGEGAESLACDGRCNHITATLLAREPRLAVLRLGGCILFGELADEALIPPALPCLIQWLGPPLDAYPTGI